MTLGDIVAESSNIGAVMVADRIGASDMSRPTSHGSASGARPASASPGSRTGSSSRSTSGTTRSSPRSAYGQGIAATPLQMVSVYSTIANDGRWVQPKLVRGTIGPDGPLGIERRAPPRGGSSPPGPRGWSRGCSPTRWRTAPGTNAQIPGYQVAGKTGTARIPTGDGSGYLEGQYIASFIGFLPAGDPEVVVAAILDRPATRATGDSPPPRCSARSRSPPSPGSASRPPTAAPSAARAAGRMSAGTRGAAAGQPIGWASVAVLPSRTLADLIADLPEVELRGSADVRVSSVCYRSSDASADSLFFCVPGSSRPTVMPSRRRRSRAGASGLVVDRWLDARRVRRSKVPNVRRAMGPISAAVLRAAGGWDDASSA